VQSVCALHKHGAYFLSQHVFLPYHSRNLDVAWLIHNYRLTRARRIAAWAFGILCNKWKIFHHVIDVYPDFFDVILKTCCMLHNFVRQRDGFQFQDTLYERPLESINPLTLELNPSAQRCLTRFLLGILIFELCISLIYACKTNKYTNYSLSLLIMYGRSYMFRHYIAIFRERS
jgi:hypothetical protein